MKVSTHTRVILMSAALTAAGLLGGCHATDPAVKRSEQAADVLVDTSQSLAVGEQTVVDSQTALRNLGQAKGDLRPAFTIFITELEAVRKDAARVRADGDVVKAQAAAYCAARQSDIRTISNDDMRQSAEARTARMHEQCDKINEMYAQTNASFANYIRNLSDLQTYLASELNFGSLDSGKRWVEEALASGEMLRGNIRNLALQIDMTSNVLSPVPIATTQWPTAIQSNDTLAAGR